MGRKIAFKNPGIRGMSAKGFSRSLRTNDPAPGLGCNPQRNTHMDTDTWTAIARIIAVLAGVVFGSAAISCASWVWLKRQIFAYGGSALCGSGVILLGLSIWHSVEFGMIGTELTLKMQASLENQLHDLSTKNDQLAYQLTSIAQLAAATDPVINKKLDTLAIKQSQLEQQITNANDNITTMSANFTPNESMNRMSTGGAAAAPAASHLHTAKTKSHH
jgi:hypothetical protein